MKNVFMVLVSLEFIAGANAMACFEEMLESSWLWSFVHAMVAILFVCLSVKRRSEVCR